MGQVPIYLDDEIEAKMTAAAESMHLSKSKWIANLINEKVTTEWPKSIVELAGAWKDLPTAEELRSELGSDAKREPF